MLDIHKHRQGTAVARVGSHNAIRRVLTYMTLSASAKSILPSVSFRASAARQACRRSSLEMARSIPDGRPVNQSVMNPAAHTSAREARPGEPNNSAQCAGADGRRWADRCLKMSRKRCQGRCEHVRDVTKSNLEIRVPGE